MTTSPPSTTCPHCGAEECRLIPAFKCGTSSIEGVNQRSIHCYQIENAQLRQQLDLLNKMLEDIGQTVGHNPVSSEPVNCVVERVWKELLNQRNQLNQQLADVQSQREQNAARATEQTERLDTANTRIELLEKQLADAQNQIGCCNTCGYVAWKDRDKNTADCQFCALRAKLEAAEARVTDQSLEINGLTQLLREALPFLRAHKQDVDTAHFSDLGMLIESIEQALGESEGK